MQLEAKSGSITNTSADTYLLYSTEITSGELSGGLLEQMNQWTGGILADVIQRGEFTAKMGEALTLYLHDAPARRLNASVKRLIIVGLGNATAVSAETARRATAVGIRKAQDLKAAHVAIVIMEGELTAIVGAQAIAEGVCLALYHYHGQKSDTAPIHSIQRIELFGRNGDDETEVARGLEIGYQIASAANLARDLVNLPPNICTPMYLAQRATALGDAIGLAVQVLELQQMRSLKMGALLAVAQGSETPPAFIIMEHRPPNTSNTETIVLIGKGVTFDTGGYSLKTADGMSKMKGDMAGGAAVIGAMSAIAQLKLPIRVVGLVPAVDNMVSGKAYRPQEVVTASNGKTIEIISTDAEGRLLLADALVYAQKYHPTAVVDIATLTGSCYVALGGVAAGLFSNNAELQEALLEASRSAGERLWPLPLMEEYKAFIRSDTADMKNSGGRYGGASIAASFLHHFADYAAWAHIDMAGLELDAKDNPYLPVGATGFGVRLLVAFVRHWVEHKRS